jgi:hypothetical protein
VEGGGIVVGILFTILIFHPLFLPMLYHIDLPVS